jgi:GntR family transcriptional regulator, transcriptional repressor for pyruvate dehydrogenase complex
VNLRAESSRQVLSNAVADRLEAEIMGGKFRPGDRLPTERALAEQLKVNRSSVREGLKKLEQLRLVHIQQGSGIRVLDPAEASVDVALGRISRSGELDPRWLADLLELRDLLLPPALQVGMRRASASERAAFASRLEQIVDPELGDAEFLERVQDIQRELAALTGNQILLMLVNTIKRSLGQRHLLSLLGRDRDRLAQPFRALAQSLRSNDAASAEVSLREILWRSRSSVLRAVSRLRR